MKNVISHIGSVVRNENNSLEFSITDSVPVRKHSVLVFGWKKSRGYYAIELPTNLRKYDELSLIKAVSKAFWAAELTRDAHNVGDVKKNNMSLSDMMSDAKSGFAIVPCDRFGEPINDCALLFADGLRKSFKLPKGNENKPQPLRSILLSTSMDWSNSKVGDALMSYCKAVKSLRTYTANVDSALCAAYVSTVDEQKKELLNELSKARSKRAAQLAKAV